MTRVTTPPRALRAFLLLASGVVAVAGASAQQPGVSGGDDYTGAYRTLVAERSESIVAVKYVITLSAGGQEQRNEDRTQGVMVSERASATVTVATWLSGMSEP